MKKNISILIPCYNESKTLSHTLPEIEAFFTTHYPDVTLIFVNDGSVDNTQEILEVYKKMSKLPVHIISYVKNKGKWFAIKMGMKEMSSDYTIMMDADLATDLECIHETMKLVWTYDIIIWDRTTKATKRNPMRKILWKIAQRCTRSVLRLPFNDTQAWYKVFSKKTYPLRNEIIIDKRGFDFEFLYLAVKSDYSIYEQEIIRKEQKVSRVSLQSYIDSFDELMMVRRYHSPLYYKYKLITQQVTSRSKNFVTNSVNRLSTTSPMSWALIALSCILLTANTWMLAQYNTWSYYNSWSHTSSGNSSWSYVNYNVLFWSSYSSSSSYWFTTSYQPWTSWFSASGTNYGHYDYTSQNSGSSLSGYSWKYNHNYDYYYSWSYAWTSYHNFVTWWGTSQWTGYQAWASNSTSLQDYDYLRDGGNGTSYGMWSIYANSSSNSWWSSTAYRSDCSGRCSKWSSRWYYSGETSSSSYNRNIQNYWSWWYTIFNWTWYYSWANSTGISYGYWTSWTWYSFGSFYSYGSEYSRSTTYGSGVDWSGSIYHWWTFIQNSADRWSNSYSWQNTYSMWTSGSGSCVYEYVSESRWKRIYRSVYNWFSSPNKTSYNTDWYQSYENGSSSSYSTKCDWWICGGGCRECGPYSHGSKCVFKMPGKAVEYPTYINPLYPYGSPVPGVDYLGTWDTYAPVCGTPPPPPSCPCWWTYPSCNSCWWWNPVYCWDWVINQSSEQCDDGNGIDTDSCSNVCKKPTVQEKCGDGIVQTYRNEVCDDGNNQNEDACNNQCQRNIPNGTWSTGNTIYLNLDLSDPISCGKPFVWSISTNADIDDVEITLEFRQAWTLVKTITKKPGSTSYEINVKEWTSNFVAAWTYEVSLVGKVWNIIRTLDLWSIPILHNCPENEEIIEVPNAIEALVHNVSDLLEIGNRKILPKTGADSD